jgi:hypothetical protein
MSYRELQETMKGLPWALEEQVLRYARSVDNALPGIFKDAGRAFDRGLGDKIVFLAGVRKLHSIVVSSYWTLDNSGKLLQTLNVSSIRAGAVELSRGGRLHSRLDSLVKSLEKTLEKQGIRDHLNSDYASLVQVLSADGRS